MKNTASEIVRKLELDAQQKIREDETRYKNAVSDLMDAILSDPKNRIVLLSGPSGSGKTTTANILCDRLKRKGTPSTVISLDNFYKPPAEIPLNELGKPDFEAVEALNLDAIHNCFEQLLAAGYCDMPVFDFKAHDEARKYKRIELGEGGIAIVEGIHALNPILAKNLPTGHLFRVYISVHTPIYDEKGNLLLTGSQMRLIRRISRDLIYRNSSVENTLKMWGNVIAGEEKYLFPYRNTADYTFATLHPYEPAVFCEHMLKALKNVPPDCEGYDFVRPLIHGLSRFEPLAHDAVPQDSLLREFIEGGLYE